MIKPAVYNVCCPQEKRSLPVALSKCNYIFVYFSRIELEIAILRRIWVNNQKNKSYVAREYPLVIGHVTEQANILGLESSQKTATVKWLKVCLLLFTPSFSAANARLLQNTMDRPDNHRGERKIVETKDQSDSTLLTSPLSLGAELDGYS